MSDPLYEFVRRISRRRAPRRPREHVHPKKIRLVVAAEERLAAHICEDKMRRSPGWTRRPPGIAPPGSRTGEEIVCGSITPLAQNRTRLSELCPWRTCSNDFPQASRPSYGICAIIQVIPRIRTTLTYARG